MTTVLITGAGSGFGKLAALEFARRGAEVFPTMRNVSTKSTELVDLAAREGLEVHPVELDVTDDKSVARGVREVLDRASSIDVLVNNAGIGIGGPVEAITDETARRVFETNFWGPVRMVRAVAPVMREQGGGRVITVSSMLARIPGMVCAGWYASTKHALSTWMESFALEARTFGIEAVLLEPGNFHTPMADKALDAAAAPEDGPYRQLEERFAAAMVGSAAALGDPVEVANAIVEVAFADSPPAWRLIGADALGAVEAYRSLGYDEYQKTMAAVIADAAE